MYEDDIYYQEAKKRVKKVKNFYKHLGAYSIMGVFLFLLNITADPHDMWFFYPLMGWGIGLAFHYMSVFGLPFIGSMDKKWEEEKIREEMAKMKGGKQTPLLAVDNHEIDDLDLEADNHREFDIEPDSYQDDFEVRNSNQLRRDFDDKFLP